MLITCCCSACLILRHPARRLLEKVKLIRYARGRGRVRVSPSPPLPHAARRCRSLWLQIWRSIWVDRQLGPQRKRRARPRPGLARGRVRVVARLWIECVRALLAGSRSITWCHHLYIIDNNNRICPSGVVPSQTLALLVRGRAARSVAHHELHSLLFETRRLVLPRQR